MVGEKLGVILQRRDV